MSEHTQPRISVRRLTRFLLTALNEWAKHEPPARVGETAASATLYSSSQRSVKATPRKPPIKDRTKENA